MWSAWRYDSSEAMNETPNIPEPHRDGCGTDVAAYALGALEPAEAQAFAAHLETCAVCREELAEFESVVSALPLSAPRHVAPDGLRQRVLDAVAAEPHPGRPDHARATPPRPRWRWLAVPRPALALGMAMAVIAIALIGILSLGGAGSANRVYNAQVTGSAATAKLAVTDGHAELIVRHMPPPPPGKIYEVWVARGHGAPQPTSALFSVTRRGSGDVAVPGSLRGVSVVMVTPEPAGGSRVPTHAPVIRAQLT
jgi:anti-sigma-K factor RskA